MTPCHNAFSGHRCENAARTPDLKAVRLAAVRQPPDMAEKSSMRLGDLQKTFCAEYRMEDFYV